MLQVVIVAHGFSLLATGIAEAISVLLHRIAKRRDTGHLLHPAGAGRVLELLVDRLGAGLHESLGTAVRAGVVPWSAARLDWPLELVDLNQVPVNHVLRHSWSGLLARAEGLRPLTLVLLVKALLAPLSAEASRRPDLISDSLRLNLRASIQSFQSLFEVLVAGLKRVLLQRIGMLLLSTLIVERWLRLPLLVVLLRQVVHEVILHARLVVLDHLFGSYHVSPTELFHLLSELTNPLRGGGTVVNFLMWTRLVGQGSKFSSFVGLWKRLPKVTSQRSLSGEG